MSERKPKRIFTEGPIEPGFVADSIARHSSQTSIGGHGIFLGQVRADEIDGRRVAAIEYTAYEEMAMERMHAIREELFGKYPLTCMHVHHSLGTVQAGAICLFVFTSAPHRKEAMEACREAVEMIKAELPVWGREVFDDETHRWKVNR